jgi:Abnormal spindle-like microcephaly-assoc'd, ASPM-SPD-2-Hydin
MVGRSAWKCRILSALGAVVLGASGSLLSGLHTLAYPATKTTPSPRPVPSLVEALPDAIRFVDVPVGDTYTQAVRVKNVSESVLQITRITASNADFQVTGIMLPVVVAPGTSETFTISYRATSEGRKEGEIGIVTSTGDTALVLNVRAVATTGQRELTASEAGVDFEDVAVGSSTKREVVLTNSGNRELRISRMSVSGADFTVSGAGAVNLSPGQNMTLDVNFAPKGVGKKAGTLVVSSAEGGSLLEIPLAATGAASSQSAVKLNWEESPVSVAGYVVYRAAGASGPYTRITSSAVSSSEFMDTGLAAGHTYYYVVAALDADQTESERSAPISATVPEA